MPDIDMDFDERRRGEMIRYTTEKYGEDRIAQIITYSTIKAKAAIKDSARVLFGQPGYAVADRITKAMPPAIMGKDIPLSGIFDPAHKRYSEATEVRALYEADPQVKEIIDTARGLEGLKRQWGVHAAGVIMSSTPLIDVIPIQRRESDGAIITQFDMGACETLGLLKMDFLGLRNLTIIDDALENIELNGKPKLDHRRRRAGRPDDLRAAGQGRDARGVPARRRADAGPAAPHGAHGVRRHLRRRRAVPARPDGRERAQRLRRPQEQAPRGHADPPGAGGAAQGHPRRDLRPDRLPGTGHGDRPEARRLHARQGGPAPPRDGQEEEGDPGQGVRRLRPGHEGPRLLRGRGQDAVGHPAAVLRLRVQPRALRRVRGRLLLDGVPQGELPGRVHGRGAHLASATTRTRPPSISRECRRMGIRVLPPDVNDSVRNFAPVGDGHPLRAGRRSATSGANVVDAIVAARKEKGGVHRLLGLPAQGRRGGLQQEGHRVADQGGGVRLARPLAQGPAARARRRDRRGDEHEEGRVDGAVRPLRLDGRVGVVGAGRRVRREGARRGVGPQAPAGRRTGDARALRLGPSAGRDRAGAGGQGGHPDLGDPRRATSPRARRSPSAASWPG